MMIMITLFSLIVSYLVYFIISIINLIRKKYWDNEFIQCFDYINEVALFIEKADQLLSKTKNKVDKNSLLILKLFVFTKHKKYSEVKLLINEIQIDTLFMKKNKLDASLFETNEDSLIYYFFIIPIELLNNDESSLAYKIIKDIKSKESYLSNTLAYQLFLVSLDVYENKCSNETLYKQLIEGTYKELYSKECIRIYKQLALILFSIIFNNHKHSKLPQLDLQKRAFVDDWFIQIESKFLKVASNIE